MISLKQAMEILTIFIFCISAYSSVAAAPKNTPACRALLLSEAERIEARFKDTSQESNSKIESIFVPENFGGNRDKALMMKGAYIAFFKKKFIEPIAKIQTVPEAYRMAADSEDYPKACDNSERFKRANDKIIVTHADIWNKALEDAAVFIQE